MRELKTFILNTNSGQTTCYVRFNPFPVNADAIEFTHITLPLAQYRSNYNFLFRKSEYSSGSGCLSAYVEPRQGSARYGYVYHNSEGEEQFSTTEVVDGTMRFNADGSVYVNGVQVKQPNGNTWILPQNSLLNLFTDEHNRPLTVGTFGKINFYYQGNLVMDLTPYEDNGTVVLVDTIGGNTYNYSGDGSLDVGEYAGTINVNGSSIADAEETNITLSVISEYDWSASTSASYISFVSGNNLVSAITGTSAITSCTINVLANTGTTQRASTVDFINATGDTVTLEITQKKPQTGSYVFCDYIQGQYGIGGSYLDLGIAPSLDTEIEIVLKGGLREQGSSNARIIGNGESGGIDLIARLDLYCQLDFGDATSIGSDLSMMLRNTKQKFTINSTGITREYVNITQTTSYNATELTGTTNNLMLNGDSGSTCNAMMYGEVIIRKNGVVVFDGKPCVYGSQVGLYDFVNDEFIAGQGKSFLAIDKYGVVLGGDAPETIIIGEDEVVRIYIGETLVYMMASAQPTPPAPSVTEWVNENGEWVFYRANGYNSRAYIIYGLDEGGGLSANWYNANTLQIVQFDGGGNTVQEWIPSANTLTTGTTLLGNVSFSAIYTTTEFHFHTEGSGYELADIGFDPEPTPVSDAISVSDNQVDNEVTFSVGFTSSTYNSIWESQIDNTAYDDAIGQGIDPDDVDWIISNGWENTNEGNPREAAAGIPCDGYKKVYFFLYDNVNDSVSTATTWSNTYNGNGDCGAAEMCGCEVCGGSGVIWNEETQEEETCWNCGGSGEVICPEPDPEPEMCGCECCGGSGTVWDEEMQEDRPCDCCGGTGQVPCP